jgi:hypothetical protein
MRSNQKFYKPIIVHYNTDKNYKVSGLVLSLDSARLEKIIQGHKFMGSVIYVIG